MRLFLAGTIDERAHAKAAALLERVARAGKKAGVEASWVKPENLHLTLQFLGEVADSRVEEISDAVRRAVATHPSIEAELGGLGTFPHEGPPEVLFAAFTTGRDGLRSLAGAIGDATASLGFPRERRAFHAHVTLARIKRVPSKNGKRKDLRTLVPPRDAECGTARIETVTLFHSTPGPGGSRYAAISIAPLNGKRR